MRTSMDLRVIICAICALACVGVSAQRRPPNYSLDEMPDIQTSFSCHDKILGGYYSDPETDCQMFHVCVRIAGVGVQDFRFLCPNDTAFDQESQICDDWYNIDCEAGTLYYSDNFDLFRLGHDEPGFSAVKATPIPLGPSSAPRIAPRPKPRRPLDTVVNNAVSENDDDLYLQRADAGDRRVSQDLLRGSSSGNFFNNRNGGKEDPDDDYVAPAPAKEQELVKTPKKKNKNQVRKLLTGKRPVGAAPTPTSTEAPTTTAAPTTAWYNRYNTVQRNRPSAPASVSTDNYPTTSAPLVPNNNQQRQNFDSQRFRANQNFAFNKKPTTTTDYAQETTTTAYYQSRGNNFYQQSSSAPAFNNYYQSQTTTTTASPTDYNRVNNYNQAQSTVAPQYNYNYNQAQTTTKQQYSYNQAQTTVAPQYNYNQAQTTTKQQYSNYNQAQTTVAPQYNYNQAQTTVAPQYNYNQAQTTVAPQYNYNQAQTTVAPQYNYNQQTSTVASTIYNPYQNRVSQSQNQQTTNYNYQNANQNYNSQTPVNTNANYDATTLKQNYYQKQTTVNYDNYYKTSSEAPAYSTAAPFDYDSANIYRQTKNQFAYNVNAASAASAGRYDAYDEPSAGESLKTAGSSGIRASDLNAIAKTYQTQKPVGFNASLTASYNFAAEKPVVKTFAKVNPTTIKVQATAKPYTPTAQQGRGGAYYAQTTSTTAASSPQPRPFSTAAPKAAAPAAKAEKDASYDYAYYDEGTGSEYDGIDPVGEEFSRTSHKHRTTTK